MEFLGYVTMFIVIFLSIPIGIASLVITYSKWRRFKVQKILNRIVVLHQLGLLETQEIKATQLGKFYRLIR